MKEHKMSEICNTHGKMKNAHKNRVWGDNIKGDLRGKGWGGVDGINMAQDTERWCALVNTLMSLQVQ
jgi:hypothetical protein